LLCALHAPLLLLMAPTSHGWALTCFSNSANADVVSSQSTSEF
jgi:hypothetical protein